MIIKDFMMIEVSYQLWIWVILSSFDSFHWFARFDYKHIKFEDHFEHSINILKFFITLLRLDMSHLDSNRLIISVDGLVSSDIQFDYKFAKVWMIWIMSWDSYLILSITKTWKLKMHYWKKISHLFLLKFLFKKSLNIIQECIKIRHKLY